MLCNGTTGSQELGTLSTCTTSPSWFVDRRLNLGPTTMSCACAAGWCLWTRPMVSRTGRCAFCLLKDRQVHFLPSKDWQVHFWPINGLAGTCFCLSRTGRYAFLPFEDWQLHFLPVEKACTSECIWSVLVRNDCKHSVSKH